MTNLTPKFICWFLLTSRSPTVAMAAGWNAPLDPVSSSIMRPVLPYHLLYRDILRLNGSWQIRLKKMSRALSSQLNWCKTCIQNSFYSFLRSLVRLTSVVWYTSLRTVLVLNYLLICIFGLFLKSFCYSFQINKDYLFGVSIQHLDK